MYRDKNPLPKFECKRIKNGNVTNFGVSANSIDSDRFLIATRSKIRMCRMIHFYDVFLWFCKNLANRQGLCAKIQALAKRAYKALCTCLHLPGGEIRSGFLLHFTFLTLPYFFVFQYLFITNPCYILHMKDKTQTVNKTNQKFLSMF